MKPHILSFIVAILFTVAAIFNFTKGYTLLAFVGVIAAISFLLAGLHWRKAKRKNG